MPDGPTPAGRLRIERHVIGVPARERPNRPAAAEPVAGRLGTVAAVQHTPIRTGPGDERPPAGDRPAPAPADYGRHHTVTWFTSLAGRARLLVVFQVASRSFTWVAVTTTAPPPARNQTCSTAPSATRFAATVS